MTAIYRTAGSLTGTIPAEHVATAQAYLTEHDMTQFLDFQPAVVRIQWNLSGNGHDYTVEAVTDRPLTDGELDALASWVSGQNSDGLGEGFEQQPFAESYDTNDYGDMDEDTYEMISFDWQTNDSKFVRVV